MDHARKELIDPLGERVENHVATPGCEVSK